ncbi:MAG: hypothetical protein HY225_04315 [Candidatus Vogelbacteria bacterium]|nr:hypothetical protein [Candidatus Vogelbacteria bacterium]
MVKGKEFETLLSYNITETYTPTPRGFNVRFDVISDNVRVMVHCDRKEEPSTRVRILSGSNGVGDIALQDLDLIYTRIQELTK